jgi:hypothetical protein
MGQAACGTCEDFETLEILVRFAHSHPAHVQTTPERLARARVLIERLRLEHQRNHAAPCAGASVESDPFPASSSEAAKAEEVDDRLCQCGHAKLEHMQTLNSYPRHAACRLCYLCRGYVPVPWAKESGA